MPRAARGLVDGFIYHVLNRGNGKQKIFHKNRDYRVFIDSMEEAKRQFTVKIFAYCLMPNHFHMVMMPIQAEELSKFMHWLMTTHVQRYHTHYESSGHIWQGRFKSFIIQEDNHLLTVLRYVEGNPVRANLVKSAKDWMWSSHKQTINESPRLLIDASPVELPRDWEQYVNEPLTEEAITYLRESVKRGSPHGTPVWQRQMVEKLGLESTLRPRGRPRKKTEEK